MVRSRWHPASVKSLWLVAGVVGCCAVAGCSGQQSLRPNGFGPTQLAHVITAGSDRVRSAELDFVSGATSVDVTSADLHGALYEAMTPADSNSAPVATVDGDAVRISLALTRRPGPAQVRIVLSSRVDWRIRLDGGASSESLELANARLSGLEFGAGCSEIEATLPRPTGTVPITMAGGASSFQVHLPSGVPARVLFAGGAGSALVDGAIRSGLAGGTVVATANWPTSSTDRYVINNTAGVSTLTLDHQT